jgi:hypothetical protein
MINSKPDPFNSEGLISSDEKFNTMFNKSTVGGEIELGAAG